MPVEHVADEGRAVDGVAERIAERRIADGRGRRAASVDRLGVRVEGQVRVAPAGSGQPDDGRIGVEPVEVGWRDRPGVIDRAGPERVGDTALVRVEPEVDRVEIRTRTPIVGVAGEPGRGSVPRRLTRRSNG